jgi:hypothetical protein
MRGSAAPCTRFTPNAEQSVHRGGLLQRACRRHPDEFEMTSFAGIKACVFDAYGTLFDVNSAARSLQDELGPRWQPLAELWRTKQLQYTWLRGLGGHHADFWTVTSDALSFAFETLKIEDPELHQRLMTLYLSLNVYPDVIDALKQLKAGGMRLAILSTEHRRCSLGRRPFGHRRSARCRAVGRRGRRIQAPPVRLQAGLRSPAAGPGSDLLPLFERLGCLRSQGVRIPRRVVQPIQPVAGAHPGNAGRANRDACRTP